MPFDRFRGSVESYPAVSMVNGQGNNDLFIVSVDRSGPEANIAGCEGQKNGNTTVTGIVCRSIVAEKTVFTGFLTCFAAKVR